MLNQLKFFSHPLKHQPYTFPLSELPYNVWVPFSQGQGYSDGILLKRLSDQRIQVLHYWNIRNDSNQWSITLNECFEKPSENDTFQLLTLAPQALFLFSDYADREWLSLTIGEFYEEIQMELYDAYMQDAIPDTLADSLLVEDFHLEDATLFLSPEELEQLFKKASY